MRKSLRRATLPRTESQKRLNRVNLFRDRPNLSLFFETVVSRCDSDAQKSWNCCVCRERNYPCIGVFGSRADSERRRYCPLSCRDAAVEPLTSRPADPRSGLAATRPLLEFRFRQSRQEPVRKNPRLVKRQAHGAEPGVVLHV